MSGRKTSERLELRLSASDVAVIDELRRMAGFPTPSKAEIIREALRDRLSRDRRKEGKRA